MDRVKNEDLPIELTANKKFVKVLLPALYQWVATLKNPWEIKGRVMKDAIKVVGRTYLGEDYEPTEDSPEVTKVSRRAHTFEILTVILFYIGTTTTP